MSKQKDNRVLGRRGARLVTEVEAEVVNGGIATASLCSIGPNGPDGDLHTGDCIAN